MPSVHLREGQPKDSSEAGLVCYFAFKDVAEKNNMRPELHSADDSIKAVASKLASSHVYSVVAIDKKSGKILGSNFLHEEDHICGVGPISVDPADGQNLGLGRMLMEDVLRRAAERNKAGVRLLQDCFNMRSLALYSKLGFRGRGTTAVLHGAVVHAKKGSDVIAIPSGCKTRKCIESDVEACCKLCVSIHGHDRRNDLMQAIEHRKSFVVLREGRITAYTTGLTYNGHSVAESNHDLKALIVSAGDIMYPGFHCPVDNGELLQWCLESGLAITKCMTMMSIGMYNNPSKPYLPSVCF
uniref:N-acetyltransferase domain-containing protein n=1 Tax=Helicotheca tamesis TaxID=374047 RepID=A0A7S2H3R7_9STRA|mmetsp:Transcript_15034/g.20478  ORF Transcript_15034/g.20478 Transcript_15034/m.20478 type:complete len:298 (+) Transcript_15034:40-933(+)